MSSFQSAAAPTEPTVFKSLVAFFCFSLNYWTQYVIQNADDTHAPQLHISAVCLLVFQCISGLLLLCKALQTNLPC